MIVEIELTTSELITLWTMAARNSWKMLSNPLNMSPEEQAIQVAQYIKLITNGVRNEVSSDKRI